MLAGSNPEGLIEFKIAIESIDSASGFTAYLNTQLRTHEILSQFNLQKV